MSSTSSPPAAKSKRQKKPARPAPSSRTPSASEIARNLKNFEIWATHQNCEQVAYSDVPADFKEDVQKVFTLSDKLPASWVDRTSPEFNMLSKFATQAFLDFIQEVHRDNPALFGEIADADIPGLFAKMAIVHSAWRRLRMMKKSDKYSEADYAANVYNVFRSPAIRDSTYKVQCNISLPQPIVTANLGTEAVRILGTKAASPDCLVMIPAPLIRSLSSTKNSEFQVLQRDPKVKNSGTASKCSSFRFQSTPCAAAPETPSFQFISSVWEDKKPVHQMLEDAYRQNRMGTTAAARHLHSLHISAPVFGLVWASGSVRAHVDWCSVPDGKHGPPVVYSAPYQKISQNDSEVEDADVFHEWQLERAGHIAEVYFMCEAIDHWTTHGFLERAVRGVKDLVDSVVKKNKAYVPWKRIGDLVSTTSAPSKENANNTVISVSTISSSAQSSPAQPPLHTRRRR